MSNLYHGSRPKSYYVWNPWKIDPTFVFFYTKKGNEYELVCQAESITAAKAIVRALNKLAQLKSRNRVH